MPAIFSNNRSGTLSADPGSGGTTLNSAAFASLDVVAAPNDMWLVLDPNGVNGAPEIVKITTHTSLATSCTVTRAQQSTTARAHPIGTVWVVAVTKSDLDELPFRKLTTTGDMLYASAANTASRLAIGTSGLPLVSNGTIPGYAQLGTAGISDSAITSAKIADGTIATGDIADSAITSAKIADGTIATGDIADGAVTAAKLASDLPLGVIGYAQVTTNQTGISSMTDLTSLSVTFTAVSGRYYRVTVKSLLLPSSAGDYANLWIRNGSSTNLNVDSVYLPSSTVGAGALATVVLASISGSYTVKASLERASGAGTISSLATSTYPAYILVEDLGT